MPTCTNHPSVTTELACSACLRPFCENCLVTISGQVLCADCKTRSIRDLQQSQVIYKLPGEALTYAIVGIFCFGIILEPIAIYKASRALRETQANPTLPGRGKAVAAMVIGIVSLALWAVSVVVQIGLIVATSNR